ncbi:phosphoribosylformylglycinamidine synthase subunit PurL [Alkalitalea saponilacus]|uniref:Phosphoribosylformylglycinamidine synthase subunit PurL n=1 Tax=Alkalitalea saponilacus TaxID=889453 RepID=A0A1T5C9S2_9BACT|nr:phosphoribosylformylglycinamidine synthase subunit PurL [Alkalitalea saponilacus]ASB49777.1 phosphoribosylformylglycinamidine synthase II [Alkalitalea saponilacus]SKB55860.1 phosphoribosylformylglycinamidine synthase [Alkalitalea saponilacus]
MSIQETTIHDAESFNLTSEEFARIRSILGRTPNIIELEIFSILWSEHASYKNSLKWLEILPVNGDGVVVEAGKESAGAIDIGDGQVCVFKVESHNHPCAVQPRLGASTGLRVVTRDIFTMGAKPLAFLDSLRFGNGVRDTARWLFEEVITGLADFEKGFGVPVVGGEVFFCDAFNSSPIVNNMVVGVANKEDLISAVAKGKGNLIAVVGVSTGDDGIDGDAFAADFITDNGVKGLSLDRLKNVEVEKSLYKIIRKLIEKKLAIGVQPIGAQGIAGAVTEMAARGKSGVKVTTANIPLQNTGLSSRDILISETWGRMLVCFEPEHKEKIESIARKAGVEFGIIGEVTDDGIFNLVENNESLINIPVDYLGLGGKAPVYEPEYELDGKEVVNCILEELPEPDHYPAVVKQMMSSLNLVSKKWLSKKFSKSLRPQAMSSKYPSDASIIEVEHNGKALVATMDCNPGYMTTDAYKGAQIAVAEAARNIVCAGGKPLAISDCLNFGNPNEPKAYGAFVASVKGIAEACKLFNVPVISGNVSFYNQRSIDGQIVPITPSPIIGMVGLLKDSAKHTTLAFRHKGDMIFLVGRSRNDVNGSEYIRKVHRVNVSLPPYYDPEEERELHQVVSGMIEADLVRSVHDVSNGGLFFTLLECATPLEFGFDITTDAEIRKDAFLFGESQSRVIVSVSAEKQDMFVDYMVEQEFPFSILGHVTKGEVRIDDESYGYVDELKKVFESQLKSWVEGK